MPGAAALLARLERLRTEYGTEAARGKIGLLREIEGRRLPAARAVARLHEILCLWRAYPDDAGVLAQVERMLAGFERRPDLRRHRRALENTGIAGTRIYYPFFPETAAWLARHWPGHVHVDWPRFGKDDLLDRCLQFLGLWAETPGLDEEPLTPRAWIERMKGREETDASFLMRRFAELPMDEFVRQALVEELDFPMRVDPGPTTPSRTRARARLPGLRIRYQDGPMARGRPDLAAEAGRPPRVRAVSVARGRELIDLARSAMVTRSRDLDVFRFGHPADVRLVDAGDGLVFVAIGVRPERRLLLEAVYGFLTLKNGVPIGYVLNSALFRSAEIAYNVFETFRGAEAGVVYGRVVAAVRHLFGADTFAIYPYQLGDGNREALDSGAWWFYQKIGFRPRDPGALRLMREELRRMKANPRHRSSLATLKRLAPHNVYFHLDGRARDDIIGELRTSAVGLRVTDYLADRFGSDRARGERVCAHEAAQRFGVRSFARWSAGERLAWRRWGPLLLLLRGVERWTAAERQAAVQVVRAKGGRRESEFTLRFDRHARLRREVLHLAREEG